MSKSRYQRLDTEDDPVVEIELLRTRSRNRRRATVFKCTALTLVFGVFVFVAGHKWWHRNETKDTYTYCGKTAQEARARGCHYAPMGRTWVPPECFFLEDTEDPTVLEKDWYLDPKMTIPADPDVVAAGELELGYTQHYHEEHCLYVMRQLAVAVALKKPMVPSIVGRLHHINHCTMNIIDVIFKAYNETERPFFNNDVTESILEFEICVPMR